MSLSDPDRVMRVIVAKGFPGGERIIEGKSPGRCIHLRPLRALYSALSPSDTRANLCRLCVYEVPRFDSRDK